MNNTNWKGIAELIGIAAIVASLIFVGLQMKQEQEIALADAYQARADTSIGIFRSISESDDLVSAWTKINQSLFPDIYKETNVGTLGALSPHEKTVAISYFLQRLTYLENVYFQYRNGFVSEEQWLSNVGDLHFDLSIDINRKLWDEMRGGTMTPSFIEVVNEVTRDLDGTRN